MIKIPEVEAYMGPKGISWAIENYRHNGVKIFEHMYRHPTTRETIKEHCPCQEH